MPEQNGTPPITYPRVTLGGVEYHVKFSLGAMYRLEGYGLDTHSLRDAIARERAEGRHIQLLMKMASAGLGRDDSRGRWKPIELGPEALADSLSKEEMSLLADAITEAWGKVPPATETPATPAEKPAGTVIEIPAG